MVRVTWSLRPKRVAWEDRGDSTDRQSELGCAPRVDADAGGAQG